MRLAGEGLGMATFDGKVALSFLVAISVAFPLFLIARERRIAAA